MLDTLVTLPQHGRKGAGSMLVRWGCEKADEVGVEAFLEASPMGAPMYARHGFQPVKTVELDLRRWSGEDKMDFIVSSSCLAFFRSEANDVNDSSCCVPQSSKHNDLDYINRKYLTA